jgi:hypothetical protein
MLRKPSIKLKAGETVKAIVVVKDPDNDPVSYRWEILPESTDLGWGGDHESRPGTLLSIESEQTDLEMVAPITAGAYRLFLYATDAGNRSATANIPFYVEESVAK